jgi:hypothetical protein
MWKKKPFAIKLLEFLSPLFQSAEQISISPFLKNRKESKETILQILTGMEKNSFINKIDDINSQIDGEYHKVILTNITGDGDQYLNSYFAKQSDKTNVILARIRDAIAIGLTALSIWLVSENNIKNNINVRQVKIIDSMIHTIDSLRIKLK